MRGRFGLLRNSNVVGGRVIGEAVKRVSCSAFSTSSGPGGGSGDGRGRGRGRGSIGAIQYDFVAGSSHTGEVDRNEGLNDSEKSYPGMGRGHGRGKPLPSSPYLPSFNTFVAPEQLPQQEPGLGRGRGGVAFQQFGSSNEEESRPKGPVFFKKEEVTDGHSVVESGESARREPVGEKKLPESITTVLSGSGRGKPERKPVYDERPKEENRHLRPRRGDVSGAGRGKDRFESKEITTERKKPKLSREEAVKRAVGILSRKDDEGEGGGRDRGRGRGRGRWSGRRQRRDDDDDDEDEDEEDDKALFMGDDADGEKLAQKLGPAGMAELTEVFEDLSTDVLPDPVEEEYIEALDTNYQIEFEPEYLAGDFETNPDIHENPPIPLRDALEKMKPFLMAYEGIESQEEWEEVMKETMERVPLLKDIVDHYCGPDRVTAKQQHGELERVAKTLSASAPNAVTRFTDRAVLSLQSNPGWGFDRKSQFMDKLVNEFSKSYK
ncbi:hypothetical protein RND81_10G104500 [Saponaria officinalis]|uniref:Uncharacterized protein n=1 Tax=Saponaria officinalis TaxID=3572 RepID=A0AAW1I077_SAPOF